MKREAHKQNHPYNGRKLRNRVMKNPATQFFVDFMWKYKEAWNNFDVDKIVASYHTPCFIFKN